MEPCKIGCSSCQAQAVCDGCVPCSYQQCAGPCSDCPVVCCRREDLGQWLEEIKLGRQYKIQSARLPADTPPWFPTIIFAPKVFNQVPIKMAAVPISRFLNKSLLLRANNLQEYLGIKDAKTIITFNVQDDLLEEVWRRREYFYFLLGQLKFDYIISPNFSNWQYAPRLEYFINIERSAIMAEELSQRGFKVIIDICVATPATAKRYLAIIADITATQSSSDIRYTGGTLHFNFQLIKGSLAQVGAIDVLKRFHQNVGLDWDFLITGFSLKEPKRIFDLCPGRRFFFTGSSLVMSALYRQTLSGGKRVVMPDADPSSLLNQYIAEYEKRFTSTSSPLLSNSV